MVRGCMARVVYVFRVLPAVGTLQRMARRIRLKHRYSVVSEVPLPLWARKIQGGWRGYVLDPVANLSS